MMGEARERFYAHPMRLIGLALFVLVVMAGVWLVTWPIRYMATNNMLLWAALALIPFTAACWVAEQWLDGLQRERDRTDRRL
jgi:hypothetical protein